MSADPLTIHGLGSDLNPYAYVSGRTMTRVDPIGVDDATPQPQSGSCFGGSEQCGVQGVQDLPQEQGVQDLSQKQLVAETVIIVPKPDVSEPAALEAAEGMGHIEAGDAWQFLKGGYNGLVNVLPIMLGPIIGPLAEDADIPKASIDPRYGGAAIVGEHFFENLAIEAVSVIPIPAGGRGPASVIGSFPTDFGEGIRAVGSVTKSGAVRNNPAAWKTLAKVWEDFYGKGLTPLSKRNLSKIANNYAPEVDKTWIAWFPEHAAYKGEIISQHHIGTLPITTPLTWTEHYLIHGSGRYSLKDLAGDLLFPGWLGH